jgi:hypothetical protein
MKTLICPISTQRVSRHVVRLTGFMMAAMIALYLLTGNIIFILAIVVDYFIRAFTDLKASPFSWVAGEIAARLYQSRLLIDKAPKIFAARVGWLFAFTTAVLAIINPTAAIVTGSMLMGFALLESVFDFCVGCLVYTYIVMVPLFRE